MLLTKVKTETEFNDTLELVQWTGETRNQGFSPFTCSIRGFIQGRPLQIPRYRCPSYGLALLCRRSHCGNKALVGGTGSKFKTLSFYEVLQFFTSAGFVVGFVQWGHSLVRLGFCSQCLTLGRPRSAPDFVWPFVTDWSFPCHWWVEVGVQQPVLTSMSQLLEGWKVLLTLRLISTLYRIKNL